jgi:hypothetical protein
MTYSTRSQGILIHARILAESIIDDQSCIESYREEVKNGSDPKETLYYSALFILGQEQELNHDIKKYENEITNS